MLREAAIWAGVGLSRLVRQASQTACRVLNTYLNSLSQVHETLYLKSRPATVHKSDLSWTHPARVMFSLGYLTSRWSPTMIQACDLPPHYFVLLQSGKLAHRRSSHID